MKNIFCFLALTVVLSFSSFAQYRSLMSANGDGRVLSPVFSQNRLTGGLSAAYSSSNVHNALNPASYADAALTALEVGTSLESGSYTFRDSIMSSGGLGINHFSVLLPLTVGKSGLGFGFHKNTSANYGITSRNSDPRFGGFDYIKSGNGNLYHGFVGTGIRFSKLKLGASVLFNFGNISRDEDISFPDSVNLPKVRNRSNTSQFGVSYNFGAQYEFPVNKTDQIILGGYYQGSLSNSGTASILNQNVYTLNSSTRTITLQDTTMDVDVVSASRYGVGVSYLIKRAMMVGTEFSGMNLNNFKNSLDTFRPSSAWSFNLGLEYRPSLNRENDGRKYFNRVTYRVGAQIGKNEQSVDGSINEFTAMAGATFPTFTRSIGYITTGFEFQQRNNMGMQNISESVFTFRLILTFADKWFIRSKFD
ncbi:MAG: hypothetical protein ACOVP5_06600 [Chitinophagales bacterium]